MSDYEIYGLLLCLIVFTVFTVLFSVMLVMLLNATVKLIRSGVEDEKIKTEYKKSLQAKKKAGYLGKAISAIFCAFLCLFCAFSVAVNILGDNFALDVPTVSVVKSGSMAKKHEKNKYLTKNGLNDQLQTFDLIITEKLPDEFALKLYDIVVYEVDDVLIVHRIIQIEEPNKNHPNERHFRLQGDALENPDRFPVRYSQMKAIYAGKRMPFIGSFVTFLQSPAGYLCILLVLFSLIASPFMDKKIEEEKRKRLAIILAGQNLCTSKKVFAMATAPQTLPPKWSAPVCLYPVYYDPNALQSGQAIRLATPVAPTKKGEGGKQ